MMNLPELLVFVNFKFEHEKNQQEWVCNPFRIFCYPTDRIQRCKFISGISKLKEAGYKPASARGENHAT